MSATILHVMFEILLNCLGDVCNHPFMLKFGVLSWGLVMSASILLLSHVQDPSSLGVLDWGLVDVCNQFLMFCVDTIF